MKYINIPKVLIYFKIGISINNVLKFVKGLFIFEVMQVKKS
jgi:hypothetical protein